MEDRAFMPVSRCEEMSEETDEKWLTTEKVPGNSYTTNVILTDGIVATTNIDVMVVMELFDLNLS
jgi:uracil phosphoribosyltransferase